MNEMPKRECTISEELHSNGGPAADPPLIWVAAAAVIRAHAGRSSDMPPGRAAARAGPPGEALTRHPPFSWIGRWLYRPSDCAVACLLRAA